MKLNLNYRVIGILLLALTPLPIFSMILQTKSVQDPVSVTDGVRICIMRRPNFDGAWDIWMPRLAPSEQLLTEYHEQKCTWDEFCERFKKEVLNDQSEYLDILIDICRKRKVTILCWEETSEKCHRRLVAEACVLREPQLKIIL